MGWAVGRLCGKTTKGGGDGYWARAAWGTGVVGGYPAVGAVGDAVDTDCVWGRAGWSAAGSLAGRRQATTAGRNGPWLAGFG